MSVDRAAPGAAPSASEPVPRELSLRQVPRLVARWIGERRPAAVVRFGEGEGRMLVADPSDDTSMLVAARKLRRQTGRKFSGAQVLRIQALVRRAFDTADVLGIRGGDNFLEEHLMWVRRIEALYEDALSQGRPPAYVSHCLFNNALRDALPELLAGQERVSVVSCRDLREPIESRYGVPDVRVYQVPSQYIMRNVDDEYEAALHDVPMWPDFYWDLVDRLHPREPGEIFLIGAGVFGKSLCIDVRERGGIALDMGSTLDGLAGKVTRGRGRPEPYRRPSG